MSARPVPTRTIELEARSVGALSVVGADECGRGSAAGPLCVGIALGSTQAPPAGLADSKLLSAKARAALEPRVLDWVDDHAFGLVSAEEIDEIGMSASLKLAAHRALGGLRGGRPDVVILDGPHDYIGPPHTVWPRIKADQTEIIVAAASVLAKEHRDRLLVELDARYPGYGLGANSGYLSKQHREALVALGPTPEHRTSWKYMDELPQWQHLRRGPGASGPTLTA